MLAVLVFGGLLTCLAFAWWDLASAGAYRGTDGAVVGQRLLALALGAKSATYADDPSASPEEWPHYAVLVPLASRVIRNGCRLARPGLSAIVDVQLILKPTMTGRPNNS